MDNYLILETLKQYFHAEISNDMEFSEDYIELKINKDNIFKIWVK